MSLEGVHIELAELCWHLGECGRSLDDLSKPEPSLELFCRALFALCDWTKGWAGQGRGVAKVGKIAEWSL